MEGFLATRTAREHTASGTLISSGRIPAEEFPGLNRDEALYEHERVPFPSYPYEWPAEMLHAAGILTLDLALKALDDGYGLKDASPYNVLFRGPRPVFVDVLSFERRDARDATWRAYAQFVRTFVLPLLAHRDLGWPLQQTLFGSRDGLDPEKVVDVIANLGNSSAATLPLALAEAERDGRLKPGSRVLLGAFGAGFTWGAGVIEWGGGGDDA